MSMVVIVPTSLPVLPIPSLIGSERGGDRGEDGTSTSFNTTAIEHDCCGPECSSHA
jgi:hypothetical protein